MGFRCGSCEEEHDGLPVAFHAHEPAVWAEASDELPWTVEGREAEPTHDAVVDTTPPPTLHPLVEIVDEPPLAEEQRRGISRARLEQTWSALLHP